jgi:hypothetical protein
MVFAIWLIAQPCLGLSGVPDLFQSTAEIAFNGPGIPSLLVVPDGSGPPFTAAHDPIGNVVDATITLYLRDGSGFPIVNFPWEDLWLDVVDGGLTGCGYFLNPDQNTDAAGATRWTLPPLAGGYSPGPVLVFINGSPLISNAGLPLQINSPDIDGDAVVNLQDLAILAGDYFGPYDFRCDLNGDGQLNLQDISIFGQHYGARCP